MSTKRKQNGVIGKDYVFHQSDINGQLWCPKRNELQIRAREEIKYAPDFVSCKTAWGTCGHSVLSEIEPLCHSGNDSFRQEYFFDFLKNLISHKWGQTKANAEAEINYFEWENEEKFLEKHVGNLILQAREFVVTHPFKEVIRSYREVEFRTKIGQYSFAGRFDLVVDTAYGDRILVDFKFGDISLMNDYVLENGYQQSIYSSALGSKRTVFCDKRGEILDIPAKRPSHFALLKMNDFIPYARKQKKNLSNKPQSYVEWASDKGEHFEAGDLKGPGWYITPVAKRNAVRSDIFASCRQMLQGYFPRALDIMRCNCCGFAEQCRLELELEKGKDTNKVEMAKLAKEIEDE